MFLQRALLLAEHPFINIYYNSWNRLLHRVGKLEHTFQSLQQNGVKSPATSLRG